MIQLDINPNEVKVLRESLEAMLSDLRYEINATDSQDYRDNLKQKQKLFERVIAQLAND